MALLSDYTAGTVSSSGSVITGTGTGWSAAEFREGDIFIAEGFWAIVASVDSNTQITLANWAGPALSNAPYRLRYASDGSRASAQARQLIDLLGSSGSLEALAAVVGVPGGIPYFTGPGVMGLLSQQDITQGVRYDVQVDTLPDRDAYDGQPEGFSVLVNDTGDGRAAIYTRVGGVGNWSSPAYITGPSITLDVTEVDEVPYGTPPDVTFTPVSGGYNLAFEIPRGMIIEPGTTTTLGPGASATVDFVPVTGGYRLDLGLPKGDTGDIDGVTPFWVTRLSNDANAAAARTGLGATTVGNDLFTATDAAAARASLNIGRTLLRITTFTTNGTWTPHADTTLVGMLCVGGGGGGGGSSGAGSGVGAGSGGGGGGMQERLLSAGWGSSQPVVVGTGGTAGSGSSGGTGGTSSIGTLCVATGGSGGVYSSTRAASDVRSTGPAADGGTGTGTGGTAAGLDVIIPGFPGQIGSVFGVGSTAMSGAGGASAMGVGGKQATEGNNGFAGRGYGGGGSGGSANDSTNRTGGAGTPGVVIITEWS